MAARSRQIRSRCAAVLKKNGACPDRALWDASGRVATFYLSEPGSVRTRHAHHGLYVSGLDAECNLLVGQGYSLGCLPICGGNRRYEIPTAANTIHARFVLAPALSILKLPKGENKK